ncbi:hypothetical protein TW84_15355 [Vibrio neptunius]|uniref:GIY-YIG nuclease family protein n=1 Tax=Vibrio neptunius TaxID=170651 RepID=UPI0005FA549B|nr:GIY-YIG nuclease family protein [Vibrio neptunius]KJY88079.1 hypothetical protein TW84_15355 [Vibrio neptunius]
MTPTEVKYRKLFDSAINRYVNDNLNALHVFEGKHVILLNDLYKYCSERADYYSINRHNLHQNNIIPTEVLMQKGHLVGDMGDYELRLKRVNAFIEWCQHKEKNNLKAHGKAMGKWLAMHYGDLFSTSSNAASSLNHIGGVNNLEFLFFTKGLSPQALIPNDPKLSRNEIKKIIHAKVKELHKPKRPSSGTADSESNDTEGYVYLIKLNSGLYKFSQSSDKYPSRLNAQLPESDLSFGHMIALVKDAKAAELALHKYLRSMEYRQPKQKYKDRFWVESDEHAVKLFKAGLNREWPEHQLVVSNCKVKLTV